jgi:hypothetical protein
MDYEPLDEIARSIDAALYVIAELLREAIVVASEDAEAHGYDPADDRSHFNHNVRRHLRENIRPYFPTIPKQAPMSPIHLPLGPHQLKVLHAEDGGLPYPRTAARKAFYERNDLGLVALNVFPPDELYVIDDGVEEVPEGTLVVVWDSEGRDLTQLALIRPTREGVHNHDLLDHVVAEADLDEIRSDREESGQGDARTGTDDRGESSSGEMNQAEDDDEGKDEQQP